MALVSVRILQWINTGRLFAPRSKSSHFKIFILFKMSEATQNQKNQILKLLKEKSVMKQDVFRNTIAAFEMLKKTLHYQ